MAYWLLWLSDHAVHWTADVAVCLLQNIEAKERRSIRVNDGALRLRIMCRSCFKKLFAGIDTGSSGLRVLSTALEPIDFKASGEIGHLQFHSGTLELLCESGQPRKRFWPGYLLRWRDLHGKNS